MLSELTDWYRVANPSAVGETIQTYRQTIETLIESIRGDSRLTFATAYLAVAEEHFDSATYKEEISDIQNILKEENPLFDSGNINLLMRVTASITVGELLSEESDHSTSIGTILIPAFSMERDSKAKELARISNACLTLSLSYNDRLAAMQRERETNLAGSLNTLPAPTDADGMAKVAKKLSEFARLLESELVKDREELDTLWWVFDGYSNTIDRFFADLPLGLALVVAGTELAGNSTKPIGGFTRNILRRQVGSWSKESEDVKSLESIVADWKDQDLVRLLGDKHRQQIVREHPIIVPVNWLLLALHEKQSVSGWKTEFKRKTGLDGSKKKKSWEWACQCLNEAAAIDALISVSKGV